MKAHLTRILGSDWGIYSTRGMVIASNFLTLLVIATLMEVDEFGRFAFMWAATLTMSAIASVGAPNLLLRELSAYQAEGYHGIARGQALRLALLWPALILSAAAAAALAAAKLGLWDTVMTGWGAGDATVSSTVLSMVAVAFLVGLIHVQGTLFRVLGRTNMAMLLNDAGPQALMLGATLGLSLSGSPRAATVFAAFLILAPCAMLLVTLLNARLLVAMLVVLPVGSDRSSRVSPFAFWGSTITTMLWVQVDILLAALFLSPAALGQYQILKRVANLASVPKIVANWATAVPVGKAFAGGRISEVQRYCGHALRLSLWPLALLLVVTLSSMPLLIALFDLAEGPIPWIVLGLLLASAAANVLAGPNFSVAAQCRMEGAALWARSTGVFVTVGLIATAGSYGEIAIAAAVLAGSVCANAVICGRVRGTLGVDTSAYSLVRRRVEV